jgi:serine/threonine protein kinase
MAMTAPRWRAITDSAYQWEREALEFLKQHLPDHDPWRVWSNFEFIDDEGKVNEVDALVLSPRGFFLVEIKSRPGTVEGDAHSWTWTTDGRRLSYDNPLILTNRKAKRLASLLKRQSSVIKARIRVPFLEHVVFLSAPRIEPRLDAATATRVFRMGRPGGPQDQGIISVLSGGLPSANYMASIDAPVARVISRAMEEAGVRPALGQRRIGDYELGKILDEGDGWQDWDGVHVSAKVHRRIRVYPFTTSSSDEARKSLGRLAAREFQVMEGIDHPGILKVRDFKESERGPALVFDHDPKAKRLDFLLREHLDLMGVELRLQFVRQLAETLKYAHGKRLYHRALSPQSILVRDPDQAYPSLQIMNWQSAARDASTGGTSLGTRGTEHLEDYVEDLAKVYIAPEALHGGVETGAHHDVFSLGAIAFHLFAGQPPAASPLDLVTKLRTDGGLRISDMIDGAMQSLVDLIRLSTHPDVSNRIGSMEEFLDYLGEAETEMRLGTPEVTVDPAVAKPGDRIDGGFTVVRRLGRGASADALLVRADDDPTEEELVLKVALDPANNDRLQAEGAALAKLHHQNVVKVRRTLTVAGRTAVLMEHVNGQTLAHHLRREERLSLDLIRRFGEQLLSAVDHLEEKGVAHRDIKPDNIGITEGKERKRLILFDFSLTRTSPDNIQAGTRPYLDPFLSLRRPPRWDLNAERFAVAVTLYEMLTGTVPSWSDEQSDPAAVGAEAVIEADRFDPHLRDGLTGFFTKALRSDARERFDNAEDMQRAWRHVFDQPALEKIEDASFDAVARRATAQTSISELGYGIEAQDVLDRMGIHTVRDLLAVHRRTLRYLTGVGDRIRREIREKAKRLAQLRPDLVPGAPAPSEPGTAPAGVPTVDRLAEVLIPRRALGDETAEDRALAVFLGLEATDPPREWLTIGQVGSHCGMARTAVVTALAKGRERWHKQPLLTALREDIRALLNAHGGVMTATELACQVLAMRGSAMAAEDDRLRLAGAVVRAAADAEGALVEPRFQVFEDDAAPLVADSLELAIHAHALGREADAFARQDPPLAPQRAMEEFERLGWPEGSTPAKPARLLTLAVATSRDAALSSRQEIYLRGMPPERALRLALGSLLGPLMLTEDQVRERVHGRYPEAAPLPRRPALDGLLAEAGAGRVWQDGEQGPGYYADRAALGMSTGVSSLHRHMTEGPAVDQTPEVVVAQQLEEKLTYALRTGGFMALTVDARRFLDAERVLLDRFPLQRVSLDKLMLDAMRAEARTRKVDWSLVLRADAADRNSRDWSNLQRLIGFALPKVEQRIQDSKTPLLLVDVGLFARYDLMDRLQPLRDASGTLDGPPGLWLLLPQPAGGLPTIGGKAVPVIGSAQWARVPKTWIANEHRAGSRPAA